MAFRTRCPSCGTLFSAPDNMLGNEIKCPRCKSFFVAGKEAPAPVERRGEEPGLRAGEPLPSEREAPAGAPEGAPGAPGAEAPVQFFCKVCNTGFTQEDILDGLAVRRFEEVYCRKHFRQAFPDECEQHPGTKAVTQCGRCGMPLCANCVIELQDEKLCSRCKRRVLGELRGDYAPSEAFAYGERPGLPWEQPGASFVGSMAETVKEVLFSPGTAFQKMRVRGGYGRPLLFVLLLSIFGGVLQQLWSLLFFGTAASFFGPGPGFGPPLEAWLAMLLMGVVASAAGALIGLFIQAAIFHVSLMIVKGAKRDYECTYRVLAYSNGSIAVLNIIPIAGQFISLIWFVVAAIIGLSRAHEISGGKAALAFFLPVIVCCGGYVALMVAIFSAASF